MSILILETSTEHALVGLSDGTFEIVEKGKSYAVSLMPVIKNLLNGHTLDAVAVGRGPGSYTGTRAGVAIAKSLSFGFKIPLLGFDSPLAYLPKEDGPFSFRCGHHFLVKGVKEGGKILEHSLVRTKELEAYAKQGPLNPKPLLSILSKCSQSTDASLDLIYFLEQL